jgi:hypothetical protein
MFLNPYGLNERKHINWDKVPTRSVYCLSQGSISLYICKTQTYTAGTMYMEVATSEKFMLILQLV